MFTPLIGRRLLDAANAREGRNRTPPEFFDEVFYPVMFAHDDYLMPAGNSKFGQLINNARKNKTAAEREGRAWNAAERGRLREEALADFHTVAKETTEPHAHLVLGGYARGTDGTTSGQVTALDHRATPDDVYLSWIGAASGAGVAGGLVLLIDHPAVLNATREGWANYRHVLTDLGGRLRPNQLETWNGQWLRHRFSPEYREEDPTAFLRDRPDVLDRKGSPHSIQTVSWASLVLALARALGPVTVPLYVYSTGQMNTTVGFIPLHLSAVARLQQSYDYVARTGYRALFGDAVEAVDVKDLDRVYDAGSGFKRACAQGAIGLRALRPTKLEDFLPGGRKNKLPSATTAATAQTPLLYETWIHAMLADQSNDLYVLASELAERMTDLTRAKSSGKAISTAIDKAVEASTLPQLVDGLREVAELVMDPTKLHDLESEIRNETVDLFDRMIRTCLTLDYERLRLFLALFRFRMAAQRGR